MKAKPRSEITRSTEPGVWMPLNCMLKTSISGCAGDSGLPLLTEHPLENPSSLFGLALHPMGESVSLLVKRLRLPAALLFLAEQVHCTKHLFFLLLGLLLASGVIGIGYWIGSLHIVTSVHCWAPLIIQFRTTGKSREIFGWFRHETFLNLQL